MTPEVFTKHLIEQARLHKKRIILPESTEPRTLKAASLCTAQKTAECVLIGDAAEICKAELPKEVEIIDAASVFEKYVDPFVEIRKHKGMTKDEARKLLREKPIYLATMMLQMGEVDGLVSGAQSSTADTIRPALQIIKTKPGMTLVSSVFFMCLPEQVLVFGDCAVNTNPTAAELSDIAIQSAVSAAQFGIEPKVAMISYSTRDSGSGPDVELVKEATRIAKERRPDLMIDGPLQYDAACDPEVGNRKAPGSKVAGHATVFVFPNLNTGNTVYKAVQRVGHIACIGPMLQGLNKPVNDLSRGCSVEDIVYTITLTAVQSNQ